MAAENHHPNSSATRQFVVSALGLGCLSAWMYAVFFSKLIHYSTRNAISHLNSTYSFACCGMIAGLLLCALVSYAGARLLGRMQGRPAQPVLAGILEAFAPGTKSATRTCWGLGAVLSACTLLLVMVERDFFRQPWCSIVSVVSGLCLGLLICQWGNRVASSNTPRNYFAAVAAIILGAAAFSVILVIPTPAAIAATAALPLLSVFLLAKEPSRPRAWAGSFNTKVSRVFRRAIVAFAMIGFAESLVRALFMDINPIDNSESYHLILLWASVIAGSVLIVSQLLMKGGVYSTNRVGLVVLAAMSFLAPIVNGCGIWANLPAMICYCFFYMLVWVYSVQTANAYRLDPRVMVGMSMGSAYAGCLAGNFLGSLVASFAQLDWRANCALGLMCALTIIVALVFVTDDHTVTVLIDADSDRPQAPRRFRLRVEDIVRDYGLTPKESQVLMLAAKGRTNQRICEELGLALGTVNTHLAHIYKKMDIHERQQLIDLVEAPKQ